MPSKKTVIVVGAGASKEVDLPTGAELKQEIAARLHFKGGIEPSGDLTIGAVIERKGDIHRYFRACQTIRAALPQAASIDSFIDARKGESEIELCGKLAIVRSILEAERNSKLFNSGGAKVDFQKIQATWFNLFWQKVSENCQAEGLKERLSSIVLIIFNYDRCVEHFLFHSIKNWYSLHDHEAASLIDGIEIFHPYGTVGSLPWHPLLPGLPFGAQPSADDLERLAGQIKTFAEGTDPTASDVAKIRNRVVRADNLIFLGFAYHPQNLKLLRQPVEIPTIERGRKVRCFGTGYEISVFDHEVIESNLRTLSRAPMSVEIAPLTSTCRDFFNDYRQTLSFV